MDSETKRILMNRIVDLKCNSQRASIAGYDQAATQLLQLADSLVKNFT